MISFDSVSLLQFTVVLTEDENIFWVVGIVGRTRGSNQSSLETEQVSEPS